MDLFVLLEPQHGIGDISIIDDVVAPEHRTGLPSAYPYDHPLAHAYSSEVPGCGPSKIMKNESAILTKNHGFKVLKGAHEDVIGSIPEAQKQPALSRALQALNSTESIFFTVGCELGVNKSEQGGWVKGYLEFAINHAELAADAICYFKLFFGFNPFSWEQTISFPVICYFELEGAKFTDSGFDGFTGLR